MTLAVEEKAAGTDAAAQTDTATETHTTASGQTIPPEVLAAIALLTGERPAADAHQLLVVAVEAMQERAIELAVRAKLIAELNVFFTLVVSAFGILKAEGLPPVGLTRVQLQSAADMALHKRLCDPKHNPDAYWRAIIMSLRAECLALLGLHGDARAAALTADSLLGVTVASSGTDERRSFIRALLDGKNPPFTSVRFLETLQASLPKN